MGKKQHSKDRMYITTTEWATEWGGAKDRDYKTPFKRLPYNCCSLAFTPFEDPVCTVEGHVFDILNIIPYIQKFGNNPVTGRKLEIKDLIKLHFHKNSDGEYHCPVLNKVFTEFSHIVAVKTTGNVFCYEAIRELNIKPRNWRELLTDEIFSKEDIITIQDPNRLDAKVLTEFDHVKTNKQIEKEGEEPLETLNLSAEGKRVLLELSMRKGESFGGGGEKAQLERERALEVLREASKKEDKKAPEAPIPLSVVDMASATLSGRTATLARNDGMEKSNARVALHQQGERKAVEKNSKMVKSQYTNGYASRSLTSTTFTPVTHNAFDMVRVERNPKKKGYLRLHTSLGDLNVEVHCDIAPRTAENFITHCQEGYYDNTVFHRSIRNFMIQGGDPTGTGHGGASIWGKPFKDELNSKALHTERGVLSMANSGPHSNGSQFFILYKSARHLDYKHSVFGRVVGGMEVLGLMEQEQTDDDDRPLKEIKILKTSVFVNPYTEMEEEEASKKEKEVDPEVEADMAKKGAWFSNPVDALGQEASGSGVGKYMKAKPKPSKKAMADNEDIPAPPPKKVKETKPGTQFGNFSGW